MMLAASPMPGQSRRIALLVMKSDGDTALCPFFGKCDGLLIVDPDDGSSEFHANTEHSAEAMCDVILKTGVHRLVVGFIAGPAARKLRAAGVDMRLGSCVCAVDDLVTCFDALPAL